MDILIRENTFSKYNMLSGVFQQNVSCGIFNCKVPAPGIRENASPLIVDNCLETIEGIVTHLWCQ